MGSYKFSGEGEVKSIGVERGEKEKLRGEGLGGGNSSSQWIAKAGWKAAETPG